MDKQKKTTVHALSLPYPEPQWPSISVENEQAILQLLLPLLEPIGAFRRDHVPRSKGKGRAGKANKTDERDGPPTWMPDVYDKLTIGFNSTVRRLESLARSRKPGVLKVEAREGDVSDDAGTSLSIVLVCRQVLPGIMTSSIPLLIATSAPSPTRARLVGISQEAEGKLAKVLQQPRLGVLGIEQDTAGAETLLRLVQEIIPTLDVPWLDHPESVTYHHVNIHTTTQPSKINMDDEGRERKRPKNS